MNGEHKILLDAINEIKIQIATMETTQTLHHKQNQKDLGAIGELNRSTAKHCHELGKLKVHRAIHWVMLGAIAVAIILK